MRAGRPESVHFCSRYAAASTSSCCEFSASTKSLSSCNVISLLGSCFSGCFGVGRPAAQRSRKCLPAAGRSRHGRARGEGVGEGGGGGRKRSLLFAVGAPLGRVTQSRRCQI